MDPPKEPDRESVLDLFSMMLGRDLVKALVNGQMREALGALAASQNPHISAARNRVVVMAAAQGHVAVVQAYLAAVACGDGSSVAPANAPGPNTGAAASALGMALIRAAEKNRAEVVRALLASNIVEVNFAESAPPRAGLTALVAASENAHVATVQALLAAPDIDVNMVTEDGFTALRAASYRGHVSTVEALLTATGINVNQATRRGMTALYSASKNGHLGVVKALLQAQNIEVNQASNRGHTVLYAAAYCGRTDVVEALLAASDIDVNQATNSGYTGLHVAAQNGHLEVVKLLLAASNIDANQTTTNGCTALYSAARDGHVAVVKVLLASPNINLNQKTTSKGHSALFAACKKDRPELVKALLAAEHIDVNQRNAEHLTALHLAAGRGCEPIVELLLVGGGCRHALSADGKTPLQEAKTDKIRAIFSAGIDYWRLPRHKQHSRRMNRRLHLLALVQQRMNAGHCPGLASRCLPKEIWLLVFSFLRSADFP